MQVFDVAQNSEQWDALRRGLPTASEMHRVIQPGMGREYYCTACQAVYERPRKWCANKECENSVTYRPIVKPSTMQDEYIYRLIAESMMGVSIQQEPTGWMQHGHDTEDAAVSEYEWLTGNQTQKVGFCTTDDGLIGCSPDRLVGEDGLLEAKCPSPWVHVRHLCTNDLADDHKVQVQAQMLVTGRQWVDVISFARSFPTVIIRANRDESYISGMNDLLVKFVEKLHRTRAELIAKYGDFRKVPASPSVPDELMGMGVSMADVAHRFEVEQ